MNFLYINNSDISRDYKKMVEEQGHTVCYASSETEVQNLLKSAHSFNAILVNPHVPEVSEEDFLYFLKNYTRAIRLIVIHPNPGRFFTENRKKVLGIEAAFDTDREAWTYVLNPPAQTANPSKLSRKK